MPLLSTPSLKCSHRGYTQLVAEFPPRMIRSLNDYQQVIARMEEISGSQRPLNRDEREYLSLLSLLARKFEIPKPKTGPAALLSELLEEHRMGIRELSKILGRSFSLCSMILNGQRNITKQHAIRLGKYFGKSFDHFLA